MGYHVTTPRDEMGAGSQRPIHGAIVDGLEVLDLEQVVRFYKYSRVVLPLDGYVFWMKGAPLEVQGSLHYAQEVQQNEVETYGLGTIQFTTKEEIVEFAATPVNTIYIAQQGDFRYAFSQQNGFYRASGFYHYFGQSIPPALLSQLIDLPGQVPDPKRAVASNSLPLWLALNSYSAPYYDGFRNRVVLYPSFAVPPNLVPPYGVVHIPPEGTRPLQSVPLLTRDRSSYQLAADNVRITLYGLQSDEAVDFLNCVLQYTVDAGAFGLMNRPIVRDGKRTQSNLQALAMEKFIDFEVDYYQSRADNVARQLITEALVTFIIGKLAGSSGPLPFTFVPPKRISTLVYPPPIYTQDTVVLQTPNGQAVVVVNQNSIVMNINNVTVTIDPNGVNVSGGNLNVDQTVVTENLDVTT